MWFIPQYKLVREKVKGIKLALEAIRMLSIHRADCNVCVDGIGCLREGRNGRECVPHELAGKGRINRKGFLDNRWFVLCFEDAKR